MKRLVNNLVTVTLSVFIALSFFATQNVFAGNPVSPIAPADNIQDPGAISTPWGGCGPTDSNCYVTVTGGGYTDEQAQDTVGNIFSAEFTYNDTTPSISINSINVSKLAGILSVSSGGTGLGSLGSANQLIRVNAGATGLEYFTPTYLTANQTITLSGDATGSGTTSIALTIANDSVALGTDTTGNYVSGATTNGGLFLTGTEGATLGILLASAADGLSSSTSSGSGLEILSSGITLLQGCADNQILKWNEGTDSWGCSSDASGGGAGNSFETISTPSGTSPVADASTDTLTFTSAGSNFTITGNSGSDTIDFDVVESVLAGSGLAVNSNALDISTGSGIQITSDAIALGVLSANWNQTGAFDISLNNASSELQILESTGATFFGIFDVGDLGANRTYTFPDVSGTIITTGDTGTVTSTMLATQGTATDEFCLTSETGGGALLAWQSCGSSVSFGTDNQIPFINAGGTDFEYSSNFTYNGAALLVRSASTSSLATQTTGAAEQAQVKFATNIGALDMRLGGTTSGFSDHFFMYDVNNAAIPLSISSHATGRIIALGYGQSVATSQANSVLNISATSAVFNESANDYDFRMEGDTDANLFLLDASLDEITLTKTASPAITDDNMEIVYAAGAGNGSDVYSVLRVTTTSANHSASSDKVYGLNIANLTSADAEGEETALFVGTGWDNIFSNGTYSLTNAGVLTVSSCSGCSSGANTALSNLASVAINTSLLPGANDTIDLGSDTLRFRDLFLGGETIHLGTSTTDEAVISYTTSTNILSFNTDSTSNGDIAFFGDDLYLDKSTGHIGIGTTNPGGNNLLISDPSGSAGATTVQIGTGADFGDSGQLFFSGNTTVNTNPIGYIPFYNQASGSGNASAYISVSKDGSSSDDKANIIFGTDGGSGLTERVRIGSGGSFGIGDTSPDYLLDVANTSIDGNVFSITDSDGECLHNPESGAETVTCSSDERLKMNIVDAQSALDYFRPFKIREYNVIASGDKMVGVIAQEVLLTNPEIVSIGNSSGMYSVQLPSQWQLVKAVQELDLKTKSIEDLIGGDNSFVGKLRSWLANSNNGITTIFANLFEGKTIKGQEKVCVGNTCIDEDQLKALIQNAGGQNSATISPTLEDIEGEVLPDIKPETPPEEVSPSDEFINPETTTS